MKSHQQNQAKFVSQDLNKLSRKSVSDHLSTMMANDLIINTFESEGEYEDFSQDEKSRK